MLAGLKLRFAIGLAATLALSAWAGSSAHAEALTVGVTTAPPFVVKRDDGKLGGIGVELWRTIAADLDLDFNLRETDAQGLMRGLEDGSLDVAIAALPLTAEREARLDFSHPFYTGGLGIAIPKHAGGMWQALRARLRWPAVLSALLALGGAFVVIAVLLWAFERRKNPGMFGGNFARGIGSGLWCAAATLTAVGYGDKAPATFVGRLLASIWMFAGVLAISGFTALLVTTLTAGKPGRGVRSAADLPRTTVATVTGSTAEAYLRNDRLRYVGFDRLAEALDAMRDGAAGALVYDAPILRYVASNVYPGKLDVLSDTLTRQYYGFALPPGSKLREPVDRAILRSIARPEWQDVLYRYGGG